MVNVRLCFIVLAVVTIGLGGQTAIGQEIQAFRLKVEDGVPVVLSTPASLEMVTGWKYSCTAEVENKDNVLHDLSIRIIGRSRIIVSQEKIVLEANQQKAIPFLLQTLSPYDHDIKIVVTCGVKNTSIPVKITVDQKRDRITFGVLEHFQREGPIAELQERPDDWVPTKKDGKGKKPPPQQDGKRKKPPLTQSGKRKKPPLTQSGKRRKPPLQQGGRPAKEFVKEQKGKGAGVPADGWKGSLEWSRRMTMAPGRELGNQILADMKIMQDLGCQIYRTNISWPLIERSQGEFRWDRTDWIINALRSPEGGGCRQIGLIGHTPPSWLPPEFTKKRMGLEAYERWVRAVVSRYAEEVDYWEIWNEPMVFWLPTPSNFKQLTPTEVDSLVRSYGDTILSVVRTASRIIRELDPDSLILSPAFSNYFQQYHLLGSKVYLHVLGGGLAKYVDAICIHNFPGLIRTSRSQGSHKAWRYFDQKVDSSDLFNSFKEHNVESPLFCTEFGGFKLPEKPSLQEETTAAMAILRNGSIMANQGFYGLLYVELYDYNRIKGVTPCLVHHEDQYKRRGYVAYQRLIAALTGAEAYVVPQIPRSRVLDCDYSGLVVKTFRRGTEDILCIWNNDTRQKTIRFRLRGQTQPNETRFWEHIRFSTSKDFLTETVSDTETTAKGEVEIQVAPLDFHIVSYVTASPGFEWLDNVTVH